MILRDPVHGLVAFESDEEQVVRALLDTAELQRLRRIRQLGFTSLSYPGADHTRFAHSLGAAHVMTRFLRRMRDLHEELPFWQRVTTERAREALAAALLHDLGHGPYSHLFEAALPQGPSHEQWTTRILLSPTTDVNRVLTAVDGSLPRRIAELVHGRHELPFLARAVSGTFDVDRCDYLLRDAHFTGVGYGRFDLDWLLRSLRLDVGDEQRAPALAIDGPKGLTAIESFVLARLFMFQQVYFHKASRASEWMFVKILERVRWLLLQGHRLVAVPPAVTDLAVAGDTSLERYLELDDGVLWTSLREWQSSGDPQLSLLATRLFARRLHKTFELFGEGTTPSGQAKALGVVRDIALAAGFDPDWTVGLDIASDVPFDGGDAGLSVLFPNGQRRSPTDVSMLLRRLSGERLERVRLVFPPELRQAVSAALDKP